jgi:hypothetical protein
LSPYALFAGFVLPKVDFTSYDQKITGENPHSENSTLKSLPLEREATTVVDNSQTYRRVAAMEHKKKSGQKTHPIVCEAVEEVDSLTD